MFPLKSSFNATLALLCFSVAATQCSLAQEWTKDPTTWWPDPSTGLMWAGQIHASPHPVSKVPRNGWLGLHNGLNWQQANDYCSSLQLAGVTGWRLPTVDELKVLTEEKWVEADIVEADNTIVPSQIKEILFKIDINTFDLSIAIWTSTPSQSDPKSAWMVDIPGNPKTGSYLADSTNKTGVAICVRPMEPDLLQTAKAAEVDHPVPDIQTLQTFIPLNNARLAYQAGNYQQSITNAQTAISLKASPAIAYWGIGISYGRLGQWDQAIANLQTSLKIDKNYSNANIALKWAKNGRKAAKKEKQPKEPPPKWN